MDEKEYGLLRQLELLQDHHVTIDDSITAPRSFSEFPMGAIDTVNMPMILPIPDEAEWDQFAFNGEDVQRRRWIVKLIASDHDTGLDGEALEETVRLMQQVGESYTKRSAQELQTTPSQIQINVTDNPVIDSGFTALVTWADHLYYGCEFVVTLTEKYTIGESG